ncbi:MAG TPA: hypothetical protein PLP29_19240, partial [Candidatus Ozemobacteraceae bacterium]|nr:hypothetical protein [Candidatus Ozemobacteraceae bacterium]
RMMAVSAGSWNTASVGAAPPPPPPPAAHLSRSRTPVASLSGIDPEGLGLQAVSPGRLKVDLTTTLEKMFIGLMIITGIGAFMALISVFVGDKGAFPFFLMLLGAFGVSCGLFWMTDNYYVVDIRNRMFLYHFHFGLIDFDWTVAPFSRIAAFSTTSVHRSSKKGKYGPRTSWYEYAAVAILDNGKIIPVTDFSREALNSCNYTAEKLARLVQTTFVRGISRCRPVIKHDRMGNIVITQEQPNDLWIALVILAFVIIMGLAAKLSGS